ncbi:MAG: hypothetical protein PW789_19115 [Edaphobacter sp.]|uniref:hypothetical protein n=1 Tax=Edaphobacter sp. TaxID=1934404 RepID=UPI00239B19AB|nr:hypothetical protein [Edaphobacter sp.]MDE1178690.1 hypothetical protein [Edaphobacter sp.]
MIRQAINCDICGAERLESTSFWFVADEIGGEIRLRGWDASKKSRRGARHLCGQKCVQHLMDNFTAAIVAGQHAGRAAAKEATEAMANAAPAGMPAASAKAPALVESALDRDDMPILERMGYDRDTVEMIEAESWAGPVRPKEPEVVPTGWGAQAATRGEKGFIHATRVKPQPLRAFQRMA